MASVTQPPAATGAKGKKKQTKIKLDIDEFVNDNNFRMINDSSWADIMEDEDVITPVANISLPSAPKSALGPEIDFSQLPTNGPFRVMVSNLQYEVNEDQLATFFSKISFSDLHLNIENGRANGTASLNVATKNDLMDAMELNNKTINGRSVRIGLPHMMGDRYGDRDGRRGGSRGGSYVDNTPSNWRSASRSEPNSGFGGAPKSVVPPPSVGYGGGGGRRDDYGGGRSRYGGSDSDGYRPPRSDGYGGGRRDYGDDRRHGGDDFGRRDGGGRRDRYGDDGGRSGGNWGRNRGGEEGEGPDNWRRDAPPASSDNYERRQRDNGRGYDRESAAPSTRSDPFAGAPPRQENFGGARHARDEEPYGGGRERDHDRRGPSRGDDDLYEPQGGGRSRGGPSQSDDYEQPRSFAPAAPPRDRAMSGRSDRSNEDGGHGSARDDDPPRRSQQPAVPRVPNSALLANILNAPEESESKPASYSSIFGGARPVDTLKRELEIEKKLAEEKAEKDAAAAALKEAAASASGGEGGGATGTSPAGSTSGERPRAPPRDRMRNGERDGNRGPRRERGGYDDRNGDRPRRDGGDRRDNRREGGGGGGGPRLNRQGGGGDRRREGDIFGEERRGGGDRGYGGDRQRGERRYDDRGGQQQSRTFYGNRGGDYDNYGRSDRNTSESGDDKVYHSSNKFSQLNDYDE